MGKLYWKFFLFFFLAQLTAITGVGVAIWVANEKEAQHNAQIEASPSAKTMVEAAAATLKAAGVSGLKTLLSEWQLRPTFQVYAVNEVGQEIQGRTLPNEVTQTAHALLRNHIEESHQNFYMRKKGPHPVGSEDDLHHHFFRSPVQESLADDGHRYLIFVPAAQYQLHTKSMKAPDRFRWFAFLAKPQTRNLFPLIPILAGILASLMFAALLAWHFSTPIKQLKLAFASATNGNLNARVGNAMGDRRDELADLGSSFDVMATRLNILMKSQTHLLHQVSHELRSPLARLQIAVGLARQQPEKLESSLQRIERESERMDSLVGELLELSRLESGVVQVEKEPIDMQELLNNVVEDARFEGETKAIKIEYAPIQKILLVGQYDLLYRAIDNVVRNAVKYTKEASTVQVKVQTATVLQQKWLSLSVQDEGDGVPKEEMDNIFDAFFRGSNAQKAEGHGVGLAIAKQVIEAHGGKIYAQNIIKPQGEITGLQVLIELPIA